MVFTSITQIPSNVLIFDIGIIIIVATIIGYLFKILKQPLIPAYIITGILLGPLFFGIIENPKIIFTLSEIGIAFLLFIVGIQLDLNKLKEIGFVSSLIGVIQIILTFFFGFVIAKSIGFLGMNPLYIGIILALSSTMIVVKLLSDKDELDTLHGRIIITILLIQDVFAIFALSFLSIFNGFSLIKLSFSFLGGILLFLIAFILSKFVLPFIFKFAARYQELLFLCSITVLFTFSLLAFWIGFSIVVGAFIAGLTLANLPYNLDIVGRIGPLKDFFSTLFFVSLGMQLTFFSNEFILPLLVFLLIVIILKPLILLVFTNLFGYKGRTSFLTSISLGQVSEFSLIIASLGLSFGHISNTVFSLTVLLTIITIILTSYFIKYDNKIYFSFSNFLWILEKISFRDPYKLEYLDNKIGKDVILFGAHRMGGVFLKEFNNKKLLVIDYNPDIIKSLIKEKVNCIYGDMINNEILKKCDFKKAKIVISTVPNEEDNLFLIRYVRKINPKLLIFVTANNLNPALNLYDAGADYVIIPRILGGEKISDVLKTVIKNKKDLIDIRRNHIKHLLSMDLIED